MASGAAGEVGGGSGDTWREGEWGSGDGESTDGGEEVGEELLAVVGGDAGACSDGGEDCLFHFGEV